MSERENKLKQEDLDKVNEYLNSPIHQKERPPFRPLYFTFLTIGSVTSLLLLAMLVVKFSGIDA